MKIVCFKPMETDDGRRGICGAVQITGYDPSKHTLRQDLPCRGCGLAGNYDGVGDDWTAEAVNKLPTVNGTVKPVREL